jgi:DNA-directed RNA polymerase omega subunit
MKKYINKFDLIILAAQRTKELNLGASLKVRNYSLNKDITLSLQEISNLILSIGKINKNIKRKMLAKKVNTNNKEKIDNNNN